MTLDTLVRSPIAWGVLAFALGLWLLLPRGTTRGWWLGLVLTLASFGSFAAQMPVIGRWATNSTFMIIAAVTVIAAAMTVTVRNPVYGALWFALSLLGTAGLFMLQGAQFLGVATVVVYASAILVTFLFVLMLANPTGHAFYDRLSWEAPLSAVTAALMVGLLTFTLAGVFKPSSGEAAKLPVVTSARSEEILASEHMAHLGGELFSRHLIAVEVAGTLLLIALVGTVAIVAESKVRRPKQASRLVQEGRGPQ